jgi:hypothetical protein
MKWNTILQNSNLFQFTCPYFYKKKLLPPGIESGSVRSGVRRSTRWAIDDLLKTKRILEFLYLKLQKCSAVHSSGASTATMHTGRFDTNFSHIFKSNTKLELLYYQIMYRSHILLPGPHFEIWFICMAHFRSKKYGLKVHLKSAPFKEFFFWSIFLIFKVFSNLAA